MPPLRRERTGGTSSQGSDSGIITFFEFFAIFLWGRGDVVGIGCDNDGLCEAGGDENTTGSLESVIVSVGREPEVFTGAVHSWCGHKKSVLSVGRVLNR